MEGAISRAEHGAAAVKKDPAKAQQDQESLALDVLLQVVKYLRQREPVPAVLADYLADAIEHAAQISTTPDADGNYPNRGGVLLKELNFVKAASTPRNALRLAEVQVVVAHMKLLTAGDRSHMKSQQELADKLGVSLSTVKRVWREYRKSNPDAE